MILLFLLIIGFVAFFIGLFFYYRSKNSDPDHKTRSDSKKPEEKTAKSVPTAEEEGENETPYSNPDEDYVGRILKQESGILLSNWIGRDAHDVTHEIDHIFLSRRGIFVFEVKGQSGKIYGSPHERKWSQITEAGHTHSFYNPLWQNKTQKKFVERVLGLENKPFPCVYSFVVFVRGDLRCIEDDHCLDPDEIYDVIEEKEEILTDQEIEKFAKTLENLREPESVRKEHIAQIQERERCVQRGICPLCHSRLREELDGSIACSNPSCHFEIEG